MNPPVIGSAFLATSFVLCYFALGPLVRDAGLKDAVAGIGNSTTTKRMMDDLGEAAQQGDEKSLSRLFDQKTARGSEESFVQVGQAKALGAQQVNPVSAKNGTRPVFSAAPPSPVQSNQPGVPQSGMDKLQVSGNGNLYRVQKAESVWKFWDAKQNIQKAVPNVQGQMYNGKGEFIGSWKTVLQAETDQFQVIKGRNGQDKIYTFQNKGWGDKEVAKDGQYLTTFPGSTFDANLKSIKAGLNEKVYAQYSKDGEDIILSLNSDTKQQEVAARIPAEVHTSLVTKSIPDGNGGSTLVVENQVTRYGVSQFNVGADGQLLTLYKGNVFLEGANGNRRPLAGNGGTFSPLKDVPTGDVGAFSLDSYGNLYTNQDWHVVVNNDPGGSVGLDLDEAPIVDDQGNVYTRDGIFDKVVRQQNVLLDPSKAQRLAAGK